MRKPFCSFPALGQIAWAGACLLLLAPRPAPAQRSGPPGGPLDSLRRVLAQPHPPDSTRLYWLQELSRQAPGKPQLAAYAREGLALARRLGHARFEAHFLITQGQLATGAGDYVRATALFQQTLRLVEARQLFHRSYPALAELGLATVAGAEEDYPTAARHSRQAVRYAHQITTSRANRLTMESEALMALTQTYTQRLESEGNADSLLARIRQYGQGLTQVARQMQAAGIPATALGTLAGWWQASSDMYGTLGRLDSARAAGQRASAAFQELGALEPYLTSQQHLINVEARAGQHTRAVALARATRALAHQMHMPLIEADCLEPLALSLNALGDGRGAYQASARALNLRDSLFSSEKRAAVSELQVRFDTERQRARVRALTQQQQLAQARAAQQRQRLWTWLVALGAGLALLGTYLWQRAAAARREAQLQLRARLAADLHDEMGALLTRVTLRAELLQPDLPASAADLADLVAESRSASATVRDIIWSVDTGADTVEALTDRLRDLLDLTTRASAWTGSFALSPPDFPLATPLRSEVRQHAYLIAKEAVTNALKHGPPAGHLQVRLAMEPGGGLALEVAHTGPAGKPGGPVARAGQGLRSMASRARLAGGVLEACGPQAEGGWAVKLRVKS